MAATDATVDAVEQIDRAAPIRDHLARFLDYSEYLARGLSAREYVHAMSYHAVELVELYGSVHVLAFLLKCPWFQPVHHWASLSRDLAYNKTFACIDLCHKHTFTLALLMPGERSHTFLSFVVQETEGPDGKPDLRIVFVPNERFTALGIPQTFATLDDVLQYVYANPPNRKTWRTYPVYKRVGAV